MTMSHGTNDVPRKQQRITSSQTTIASRKNNIPMLLISSLTILLLFLRGVESFLVPSSSLLPKQQIPPSLIPHTKSTTTTTHPKIRQATALSVWWFGGTPSPSETSSTGKECELVAVRIDRTSPNSRRISGEIVVDAPLRDVWAILTDYDNLSTHVPNLVASKRIRGGEGHNGDGRYQCRLYQRGAQKIIGFEFGADVTMDMQEEIVVEGREGEITASHHRFEEEEDGVTSGEIFPEERRIRFKCVDSQFFSEFDGTWTVTQAHNPYSGVETTVSYSVDVRPKGPVPVAALEWRIREDVPTNLRAVKKAALEVGWAGVHGNGGRRVVKRSEKEAEQGGRFADFILDYENETLGAYLE
ncbi:hypothetical protein HJC23_006603 [Cyclotella cryptica]|uniref:Coenzyme Q-binding protein COQ10 START domain-containing protein n=1 Tax=Cyclotella cryptica TaxID=29204 RepID=A0ABD3QZ12_9STRA|eukprot:CCRYP_000999-RA/>CCRYP_000999-RA protein AED:0.37 eAED:0.37 QI:0/-1/0/1/-1/1/1/0/356